MNRNLLMCSLVLTATFLLADSAMGQGLRDRLDHVREQRRAAEANNTTKGHLLSVLLYRDIESIEFQDQEVRDVIQYLRTLLGIPIIARWSDDRIGHGIDPETRISLRVENQPALRVLEMILEQCAEFEETAWQLRDGFVEIGTKERLALPGAQEIRYYPIRDLLFEPPNFDNSPEFDLNQALRQGGGGGGGGRGGGGGGGGFGGGGGGGGGGGSGGGGLFGAPGADPERLTEEERAEKIIELIVEFIEPRAWDLAGGTWATIRFYQGTLIIRAPDFVHRQVGGYPYRTSPVGVVAAPSRESRRYVTFTGGVSRIEVVERVRPNIGTDDANADGKPAGGDKDSADGGKGGKSKDE